MKSGFIALIGAPNVGKSTILNTLIGKKIASVTPKPQTTTTSISGIYNREDIQIVFLDTPGIHKATREYNKIMNKQASNAIRNADGIVFIIDPTQKRSVNDLIIARLPKDKPLIIVINKIDLISPEVAKNTIEYYKDIFKDSVIIETSAIRNFNLDEIVKEITKILPEGPMYYPPNMDSDVTTAFLISETIREKIMMLTKEEIPHSIAVIIDNIKETDKLITAHASIIVERASQKGIIIGQGGKMIKRIRLQSEYDLRHTLNKDVHLELFVRVEENWRDNPASLRKLNLDKRNI
jgi:GTP-binding protein Era